MTYTPLNSLLFLHKPSAVTLESLKSKHGKVSFSLGLGNPVLMNPGPCGTAIPCMVRRTTKFPADGPLEYIILRSVYLPYQGRTSKHGGRVTNRSPR